MSGHKLAEALRACLDVLNELPTWSNAGHAVKLGNEALAAHEAEQQAGEAVASIYISANGEREFDDWKHTLPQGEHLLFTHPQQPLSDEQIDALLGITKDTK